MKTVGAVTYTETQLIAALKKTGGKAALAAEALGCSPSTMYKRIAESSVLREIVEGERMAMVDLAELKLKGAIMEGQAWAVCFTLKCLGKSRGWVERHELDHRGSVEINGTARIVEDRDWYGNADRIPADGFEAPNTDLDEPGQDEGDGMREAVW